MENLEQKIADRLKTLQVEAFIKYSREITVETVADAIAKAKYRGNTECVLKELENGQDINKDMCARLTDWTNEVIMQSSDPDTPCKYVARYVMTIDMPIRYRIVIRWT